MPQLLLLPFDEDLKLTNFNFIFEAIKSLSYLFRVLKEYYEIVGESRPLSAFFPKHADSFTEMHF